MQVDAGEHMTGRRTQYILLEYAAFHLMKRRATLTSRQIVEILCDAGCGYFAPPVMVLGSKMRCWSYDRRSKDGAWSLNSRVKEPERPPKFPKCFDRHIDEKWPLNK